MYFHIFLKNKSNLTGTMLPNGFNGLKIYIFLKHKVSILVWSRKLKQEWCEDWLQSIRSDKLQNKQSY